MEKIKEYFEEMGLSVDAVERRLEELARHDDLAQELESWIANGANENELIDGVSVEGYTAKKIKELAPFMNAAGVYNFLIELRENSEEALGYINEGFMVM